MVGFLRGFFPLSTLYDPAPSNVHRSIYPTAVELLLLGELDLAISILALCEQFPQQPRHFNRFWERRPWNSRWTPALHMAIDAARKEGLEIPQNVRDVEALLPGRPFLSRSEFEVEARKHFSGRFGDWNFDAAGYDQIMRIIDNEEMNGGPHSASISAGLAACCCIAYKLGWDAEVDQLTKRMARRIQAGEQVWFLVWVREAWGLYVQGGLRDLLDLDEGDVKAYGEMLRDTLSERVREGAKSCEEWAGDKGLKELLEIAQENTKRYDPYKEEHEEYVGVLLEGASDEEIAREEQRLGVKFPEDLKELYMITNGTERTVQRAGPYPSMIQFFGPLADFKLELPMEKPEDCHPVLVARANMEPCVVVDLFDGEGDFDIKWPTITRCVAINKCTEDYNNGACWMLLRADILKAKDAVNAWLAEEGRSEETKEAVERAIRDFLGSRETFEKLGEGEEEFEGFIYSPSHGTEDHFFPHTRALVCWLAFQSSLGGEVDPSPMPAPDR